VNDFLNAVKDDLLDRRLLPLVALAAVALLGALGYVVLGGSSKAALPPATSHLGPVAPPAGVTISQVTPEHALAETTSGGSEQHQGPSHNPFGALSEVSASTSSATGSTAASTTSSSGSSPASTPSTGGASSPSSTSTPSSPPKTSVPAKPKTLYEVAVLFGEVPPDSTTPSTQLTLHEDLKLLTPLPSSREPLLVYRGVEKGGKRVTFTVSGEVILHGDGVCAPSESRCETISLKSGQAEQLEYVPANAQSVVSDELRVASIAAVEATAANVASLWKRQSVAGLEVLRKGEELALPGLRETVAGVLVPAH
jgi:hypothetical protein